jgi:hypothetical protein
MTTEEEIVHFAEQLYKQLIENFNKRDSPFLLLTQDDATFSQLHGIKSENIRNVLIGGHSSGTATYQDFITARALYEASSIEVALRLEEETKDMLVFTKSTILEADKVLHHLIRSTAIIINRIWTPEIIKKYVKQSPEEVGILPKTVIRVLFGVKRRQKIALYKLNMPLHRRIALLNECIKVCNVLTPTTNAGFYAKIDKNVAIRAYKRVVEDTRGQERDRIDICLYTKEFPTALKKAIKVNGFIDEWAYTVNFDPTLPQMDIEDESPYTKRKSNVLCEQASPDACIKTFTYQKDNKVNQSSFWFMSVNNSFLDSFWAEWIAAIDQMRFCIGL